MRDIAGFWIAAMFIAFWDIFSATENPKKASARK
jgi:hypothetical protein